MSPGMDKKNRKERGFAQDIDHIIAGKQAKIDEAKDEDYRSNIDFVEKIIEYRGEPSPSFQEGLKRRLLTKLVEQEVADARPHVEAKSFLNRLRSLVFQRYAWRTAALTVTIAALALVVVWRTGLLSPIPSQELTQPASVESVPSKVLTQPASDRSFVAVEGRAVTTKVDYVMGEEIYIQFPFKNITAETLTLPFPPAIRIEDTSGKAVRTFTGGQQTMTLAPGESARYDLVWDQKDATGKQVPPGEYQVVMPDIQLEEGKGLVSLVESTFLTISISP